MDEEGVIRSSVISSRTRDWEYLCSFDASVSRPMQSKERNTDSVIRSEHHEESERQILGYLNAALLWWLGWSNELVYELESLKC